MEKKKRKGEEYENEKSVLSPLSSLKKPKP